MRLRQDILDKYGCINTIEKAITRKLHTSDCAIIGLEAIVEGSSAQTMQNSDRAWLNRAMVSSATDIVTVGGADLVYATPTELFAVFLPGNESLTAGVDDAVSGIANLAIGEYRELKPDSPGVTLAGTKYGFTNPRDAAGFMFAVHQIAGLNALYDTCLSALVNTDSLQPDTAIARLAAMDKGQMNQYLFESGINFADTAVWPRSGMLLEKPKVNGAFRQDAYRRFEAAFGYGPKK